MEQDSGQFVSGEEERDFRADHDSAEYVDRARAERVVLPDLKPSATTISLRPTAPGRAPASSAWPWVR